ncbi:MAG: SDR family oxidoreductase [Planctomycetes bacterium]|nr:SDR family oxidoreductase [Planctomycetota bacterium]
MESNRPIALVTGASAGIGRDFAELLARDHYDLVLVARDEARLRALAAELESRHGVNAFVIASDLSAAGEPARIFELLRSKSIQIGVLINNAGFGTFGLFVESDAAAQTRMIDLNVRALTELTRLFLPDMVARRNGRLLHVASTAAFQPGPTMAVYYATKAYVLSFSEALCNELEGTGVTSTVICPGPTDTEFQSRANMDVSSVKNSGWMMTSRAVAEAGLRGMRRGKRLVIPGFINLLIAESVRFAPRAFVLRVARMLQNQVKEKAR